MKTISSALITLSALVASTNAFAPSNAVFGIRAGASPSSTSQNMVEIAEGVEFDTVAREWRCKWTPDGDKASLVAAQEALKAVVSELKGLEGVKRVDRVVCGGCLDFKVVTSLEADKFGNWEENKFAPEEDFVSMLKAIDGVSQIETQTYTLMPID